jgi:hypothetical protein
MSWLQDHLENFVKPLLGEIPILSNGDRYFTNEELVIIKAIWRAVRNESKRLGIPILFPGRDTWVWEVLARRENYPTVFRPDISATTCAHVKDDYSNYLVLDTGYSGSVPKALKCKYYLLGSSNSVPHAISHSPNEKSARERFMGSLIAGKVDTSHMVFPRMSYRGICSKIEISPKYWSRASYVKPGTEYSFRYYETPVIGGWEKNLNPTTNFVQGVVDHKVVIRKAALLTIEVYTNSAPRFLPRIKHKLQPPVKKESK